MELKIQSLNVRLWTKENNPFKPHFWLWRTFKQAIMFLVESPDVICLQEVQRPVGGFLLGLWRYKRYGGWKCHTPIYVKKKLNSHWYWDYKFDNNGHETLSVVVDGVLISNCHLSWAKENLLQAFGNILPLLDNEILCGDFNSNLNYIKRVAEQPLVSIREQFCSSDVPTFYNYNSLGTSCEIDHFFITQTSILKPINYTVYCDPTLSDHCPISTKICYECKKEA